MTYKHDYSQHNIGEKFGKLELIQKGVEGWQKWLMRCSCGTELHIQRSQVVKVGGRVSCGAPACRKNVNAPREDAPHTKPSRRGINGTEAPPEAAILPLGYKLVSTLRAGSSDGFKFRVYRAA